LIKAILTFQGTRRADTVPPVFDLDEIEP